MTGDRYDNDDGTPEPADIGAERYLLGAMMAPGELGKASIESVAELMEPGHFYRAAHGDIYRALILMWAAKIPIDPITLNDWLKDHADEVPRAAQDPMYLAELYGLWSGGGTAEYYARIVLKYHTRRAVAQAGLRLVQEAQQGELDSAELVDRSHRHLDGIMASGQGAAEILPLLSVDDIADSEDSEVSPVIGNLLMRYERVLCVAPPGAGKSVLALQMAFCTATGIHPFSHRPAAQGPQSVLVMDWENPPHIVQRRFRTMREIAGNYHSWDAKNLHVIHKPGGINLLNQREAYAFAQRIKSTGARLVVGGPLYKMMSGMDKSLENYEKLSAFWDRMREDYGIALWMEVHPPFGGEGGKKRVMRPEGSNVWEKWPEFGVALNWATKAHGGQQGALDWSDFRGQREEGRKWPAWITRNPFPGSGWPWVAQYERDAGQRAFGDEG